MKSYILSIAAAAVISAVMGIATPVGWTKYIGIITGLTVVICIGQPILKLTDTDIFDGFAYDVQTNETAGRDALYGELRRELCERIERDAAAMLKNDFGRDCCVKAELELSDDGKIAGVLRIVVYGDRPDAVIKASLREKYGAREVECGGSEEIAAKSE